MDDVTVTLTQDEIQTMHRALSMTLGIWRQWLREGGFDTSDQRELANRLISEFQNLRERLPPPMPLS